GVRTALPFRRPAAARTSSSETSASADTAAAPLLILVSRPGPVAAVRGCAGGLRSLQLVAVLLDHHARHVHHQVALVEVHQLDALGGAADHADLLHRLTVHDALLRHDHELLVVAHRLDRHDAAGLV